MEQTGKIEIIEAIIHEMNCPSCAQIVQSSLNQLTGVYEVALNFATGKLNMSYNSKQITQKDIFRRIQALGYEAKPIFTEENPLFISESAKENNKKSKTRGLCRSLRAFHSQHSVQAHLWQFYLTTRRGQRVILSGIILLLGFIIHTIDLSMWIERSIYLLAMVLAGYPIARAGFLALNSCKADINLLITVSSIGTCLVGNFLEGAMVVFLFSLGTTLQNFTLERTRNTIQDLINLTPSVATVKRNSKEITIPISNISVDEIITVRPGQRIPFDGKVIYGISTVDQSPITGESVPVDKKTGDSVFAGTLNQTGYLEVKTRCKSSETIMARIIHLVESAQFSSNKSQQWIDNFVSIYTPTLIIFATAIAIIPPLFFSQDIHICFYNALVLLVIACPCALVISTPVSIISAIGAASRKGILFKSTNSLETAGKIDIIAFDKTATLTQGLPKVVNIYSLGEKEKTSILQIAASLEQQSEHPFAKAIILEAQNQGLVLQKPYEFIAKPGKGIQAKLSQNSDSTLCDPQIASLFGQNSLLSYINRELYMVGNPSLFSSIPLEINGLLAKINHLGQTPVLVGTKQGLLGIITLADRLRVEAKQTLNLIQTTGVKQVLMLTGDSKSVAQQIVKQLGIAHYRSELLPQDKLQEIEKLKYHGIVAMVGDGINDAPALASADVSFSIGHTDLALETADVVLLNEDLRLLAHAIYLSRKTASVIQQNIIFSLLTKALFLFLGTFGIVGIFLAVLVDTATSLLVTLNGMRLFNSSYITSD